MRSLLPPARSTRRAPPRSKGVAASAWLVLAVACGSVPVDSGARIFAPKGVIRGTVSYQGPRPCSRSGHIVGSAVLLVFDRRNPPPPDGTAATAVNFVAVTGDVLFASEPRFTGSDTYCPVAAGFTQPIAASAPFQVAPLDGASYEIRAFYDSTGNFLPEFSIRNLPERGDIAGGAVDTADAIKPVNAGNPDYRPLFLPIDVGVAQPVSPTSPMGTIPTFAIPDSGFLADDVTVTIAAALPTTRPYFYAQGEDVEFDDGQGGLPSTVVQSSDVPATNTNGIAGAVEENPNAQPVLTIPEDIGVFAPPAAPTPQSSTASSPRSPTCASCGACRARSNPPRSPRRSGCRWRPSLRRRPACSCSRTRRSTRPRSRTWPGRSPRAAACRSSGLKSSSSGCPTRARQGPSRPC